MYLDCEGLVTVGLGHQIQKAENAMKMTFRYRNKPGDVDVADIKTAYNAVLNSGLKCKHHTRFEKLAAIDSRIEFDLDLDLNEIERMFDEDVRRFGVSKPMTETSIRCLVSRVWPPAANRPRDEPAVEAGRG